MLFFYTNNPPITNKIAGGKLVTPQPPKLNQTLLVKFQMYPSRFDKKKIIIASSLWDVFISLPYL